MKPIRIIYDSDNNNSHVDDYGIKMLIRMNLTTNNMTDKMIKNHFR